MFEIGHTFKRNGLEYCVLDIIDYHNKKYLLISEKGEKVNFDFYEVTMPEPKKYKLIMINDEEINNELFSIFSKKNNISIGDESDEY